MSTLNKSLSLNASNVQPLIQKDRKESDSICSICLKCICCWWFWVFCCVCKFKNCKDLIVGWIILIVFYIIGGWIWYYGIKNGNPSHLLEYTLENINNSLKPYTGGGIDQFYNTFPKQIQSLFATLYQVYPILIIVITISIIVTQIYVYILSYQRIRSCIYKLAIIKSVIFGFGTVYLSVRQATQVHGTMIQIGQYSFAACICLYTLYTVSHSGYRICCDAKYKKNATQIERALTEASIPIGKYKCIAFTPLLWIVLMVIWSVLNVYLLLCVYTSSIGKPIDNGTYPQVVYQSIVEYKFYLSIIIGIWITNTIYIFGCLVIARIICIVNKWNYNYNADRIKRCFIVYAIRDIFNNHLGTVSICALFMLCAPYIKLIANIFNKISSYCGKCIHCGTNKCCKDGKCLKCVCGDWCICIINIIIKILNFCCLRSCRCIEIISKGIYKCLAKICCIGIVGTENLSVIGLKNYTMCGAYNQILPYLNTDNESSILEIKEKAQAVQRLDKKVEWALWVAQIWIPLFTCCLTLVFIEFINIPIGISGQVNSLLFPAITSFIAGYIIGNLYMSIYRFSAHLAHFNNLLNNSLESYD